MTKHLFNRIIILVIISTIAVGCGNSIGPKQRGVSVVVPLQEETLSGFWDRFDFADTALIHRPDITEQMFADFLMALSQADDNRRNAAVDTLLTRSLRAGVGMFLHFTDLSEKYLDDPNSPYRNEEAYIPFLEYIVNSKDVDSLLKIRPRYQLAMAMKNRRNTIATDFTYTLRNGRTGRLHDIKSEYTLLYFNNPDCPDCKRVKEILSAEAVFAQNPKLEILSIYPDKDLSLWNETIYPEAWIDARCREITEKGIYDLRAIPTLYLLDSNKRVVLKDAPVGVVGQYLATH